jgi:hypothetical protein
MLNWNDLSVLLMVLAGPLSGVAAARHYHAGVGSLILLGVVGLVVGFGIGMASSKMAYRVLDSKTMPAGLQSSAYAFVPMLSLLLVMLVPPLLAMMIYGRN